MRRLFLAALFSFAVIGSANAAETYTLDPSHTNIDWRVTHMGYSHPSGKITDASGTIILDEANPANSKVSVDISPANFLSGVPKLDEHMKSKDFFNVVEFPKAKFVSTKVELTGKETAKITGDLTLMGVTKPVILDAKLNKIGEHPFTKAKTVGFSATTTIKRSEFGMTQGIPMVSDDVALTIETEASIASAAPAAPIAKDAPVPAAPPASDAGSVAPKAAPISATTNTN